MVDSLESFEPSLETFQYKRFEKYKGGFAQYRFWAFLLNPPLNLFSMAMVALLSVPPLNLSLTLLGPALEPFFWTLHFEPFLDTNGGFTRVPLWTSLELFLWTFSYTNGGFA